MERSEIAAFYRRYHGRCNAHEFGRLTEFVTADVQVNGALAGSDGYIGGLETVCRAFPDLHWELMHLFVDPPWIAGHFTVTGTHQGSIPGVEPTGRTVRFQEFAIYRLADGKIAEVWGDLGTVEQIVR